MNNETPKPFYDARANVNPADLTLGKVIEDISKPLHIGDDILNRDILQEVDGFYYYYPPANGGCFAAHTLRTIADRLDQLNDTWNRQVEKELNNEQSK